LDALEQALHARRPFRQRVACSMSRSATASG
jgi:hypothetical protein